MSRKHVHKPKTILFAAGEAVPFAKVGGLADVITALAKALKKQKYDIRIIMPKYKSVSNFMEKHNIVPESRHKASVMLNGKKISFFVEEIIYQELPFIFVNAPEFFDRDGFYTDPQTGRDFPDNLKRYVFFDKAVLESCKVLAFIPDILHCHDWHMGLVPLYKKALPEYKNIFTHTHTVFTIHNLSYQGIFPIDQYPQLDLDWKYFNMNGLEYYRHINFLKGGIVFSEAVNTVSQTYAREIQTEALGAGLEGVIQEKSIYGTFYGIMNGVDYSEWDPKTDTYLMSEFGLNYDIRSLENKQLIKEKFAEKYGLHLDENVPLVGMITRLFDQKGLDIFLEGIEILLKKNIAFAILGTGKREYEEKLIKIAYAYPQRFFVRIGFDIPLSHTIEAAADMFLMPSNFEPSGLNQLYSMRYGTVPIVRKTGGLADSVTDGKTGFVFDDYHPDALIDTVLRAVHLWRSDKKTWLKIMKTGMKEDWSWKRSAKGYIDMYKSILQAD